MRDNISVLVTGGTSGVGLALVRAMSARGWRVNACGRDPARLAALRLEAPSVAWERVDLANPEEVETYARSVRASSALTGLINNAAIQENVLLSEQSPAQIDREIRTNLTAPAILAGALAHHLPKSKGFIVNVTSGLAIAPKATAAVYCATKAGLRNLSVGVRHQLCDRGVAVIDIVLPLVDTPMTAGRGAGKLSPTAAAKAILEAIDHRAREKFVGKAALLAAIDRLSPRLARHIMRGD